jgi:hypothetical protein
MARLDNAGLGLVVDDVVVSFLSVLFQIAVLRKTPSCAGPAAAV